MTIIGKTVRLFLVDGTPNGVLTAEIMNWTGKFTVAPRSQLSDLKNRQDVKRSGIYILSGEKPDNPSEEMIYVGESDNVWERLVNHNRDNKKDFWQRTVIVTSKDQNLTKAHIRYLESRLIQIIAEAQRVTLSNNTNPDKTNLPEPDIADMEYFLGQIRMLLPVLGFSFAISLPSSTKKNETSEGIHIESPVFIMTYGGTKAYAQEIGGEFIVLKGSTARKRHTKTFAEIYIQMRNQLIKSGKLTDLNDKYWEFTQDVPFTSTSTAANVVGGASLNGRVTWKDQTSQKTYAQWQEDQTEEE